MKKIINGRIYDTDKAKNVGSAAGGDGFSAWVEELYQKRTGEFFLSGKGGPATKYAYYVESANAWSGGSKIIPLPYDAAREWAEAHLDADEYGEIFGVPSEDEEPVVLHLRLPAPLAGRIRAAAVSAGTSVTAYLEGVLSEHFE